MAYLPVQNHQLPLQRSAESPRREREDIYRQESTKTPHKRTELQDRLAKWQGRAYGWLWLSTFGVGFFLL